MLQVEHGIALLGVLGQLILGRRVDQGVAPLAKLGVGAMVVDAAHLTVRNALLRTVVVALGAFGHLKAASLTVAAEVGLRGGIDEVHAVDVHEIIVETYGQRVGNSHEGTLSVGLHVVLLAADVDNDLAGLRSLDAEVGPALLVNLRELIAGNGVLHSHGIGRHLNLLRHVDVRTLRLKAEVTGHGLSIAAA